MMPMVDQEQRDEMLAARNRRLAIVLGLAAAAIYGGYILAYYLG